jgi:malonyl-CoA/methylmalonyl-CoA synthetase
MKEFYTTSSLAIVRSATRFEGRVAIVDRHGAHPYGDLLGASARVAEALLGERSDLLEEPVAFMVQPGVDYVSVLWGIWRAGGIAVPLCPEHPAPELEHVIRDSGARRVVCDALFGETLGPAAEATGVRLLLTTEGKRGSAEGRRRLPDVEPFRRALILYTSGTTGRPKGVVSSHGSLTAQVETLVEAWGWTAEDRILHVLPLHHTHGIVNALLCALWSGATCEMLPRFDPAIVWERLSSGEVTLFMAVPTIYVKLIAEWEDASASERAALSGGAADLRLMVSGSAALPTHAFERWLEITGHELLERYGMTEIGMAISNPLDGERRPGYVGIPLPGVSVRLVDEEGERITEEGEPGRIQVRGPGVFLEYWKHLEDTRAAYQDAWFDTGDEAVVENGYYRILGRTSVDIIKTGGYKVSALEIENVLRGHPEISDCAVVGVPDLEWGERVCMAPGDLGLRGRRRAGSRVGRARVHGLRPGVRGGRARRPAGGADGVGQRTARLLQGAPRPPARGGFAEERDGKADQARGATNVRVERARRCRRLSGTMRWSSARGRAASRSPRRSLEPAGRWPSSSATASRIWLAESLNNLFAGLEPPATM